MLQTMVDPRMGLLAPYLIWTPLTVVAFVAIGLGGKNPLPALARAARDGRQRPGGRLIVGLVLGVILFNLVQCQVDPGLTQWLGYEMTGWIQSIEGDLVARVQASVPAAAPVLPFLGWLYLAGYIAVLITLPIVWTHVGKERALAPYLLAFLANYSLALPFYFFAPVTEVAFSGLSTARPLLDVLLPGITDAMRVGSSLDNCFPSLHVSCTVTALWFGHRHGPQGLRILTWMVAVLTAWAVMALGIHWGIDVATGIPFGIMCALLGESAAARLGYASASQKAASRA